MPIKIPKQLPARELLRQENIFVMDEGRARTQDIRPLDIVILNLMPEKEKAELQLLRLLGNTTLQVNITFLHTATYESKNVSKSHLDMFYSTFAEVKHKRFDGMIITGAPVEQLPFEDVHYWEELATIMEWTNDHVTSVFHICWGAQAALYYHYGIDKYRLSKKCFGVYSHQLTDPTLRLTRGFNEQFLAPHSRHTEVLMEEIEQDDRLKVVAYSEEVGAFLIKSVDSKHIMMTGHLEYDATTLAEEYHRDIERGIDIQVPYNYFPNDDPEQKPSNTWRAHTHLLFSNWLNYYVYQETPYEWVNYENK